MRTAIRLVIAQSHAEVRSPTRAVLESDPQIEIIGEAIDEYSAVERVSALQPHLLVFDLPLSRRSGIAVLDKVREVSPFTRVLVLSPYNDEDYVVAAMEAGVSGYLLTTANGPEVLSAVHSVADGDVVFDSSIAARFLHHAASHVDRVFETSPLTRREFEILRLAGQGLRNREIAEELNLSRRTVETHLSRAFAKLRVNSRTQALRLAMTQGWFAAFRIF